MYARIMLNRLAELDEFRARLTASETESKELKKIIEGA
jgi:hypothetical protein